MKLWITGVYCDMFGCDWSSEPAVEDTEYVGEAAWLGGYKWYPCKRNCGQQIGRYVRTNKPTLSLVPKIGVAK